MMQNRREIMLSGLAGAILSATLPGEVLAQARQVGAITVSVSSTLSIDGGRQAETMRGILDRALREAFANRMVRGGPTLLVTIRSLSINFGGGNGRRTGGSGGGTNDTMETHSLLVSDQGRLLSQTTVLSPVPGGGMLWSSEIEQRRLVALANHNAGWIRRRI